MPDGVNNVAEKCDLHQNRTIVASHGDEERAAVTVVPDDPSCTRSLAGAGRGAQPQAAVSLSPHEPGRGTND